MNFVSPPDRDGMTTEKSRRYFEAGTQKTNNLPAKRRMIVEPERGKFLLFQSLLATPMDNLRSSHPQVLTALTSLCRTRETRNQVLSGIGAPVKA
jgi:hypothetical protein